MITPRGYDYSGLPSYGTDVDGRVYVRSHVEYRGRTRMTVVRSDWMPTGRRLDTSELGALSTVAQAVACAHGLAAGQEHDRIEGERLDRIRTGGNYD